MSAFSITAAQSLIAATTKAAIDVTGATLENKAGDLTLATRGVAHVRPSANLLIASALAGGAGAEATGTTNATQAITVTDSTLKGTNVELLAGRDGTGVPNLMDSTADVQITTISLYPSIGIPLPSATIDEINVVTLAGTTSVLALQDVDLLAIHGLTVAETDGLILSLSLVPYGAPALDGSSTSTSNTVTIGPSVSVEAGLNATVVVLIKPVGDAGFAGHTLGDELSDADKAALAADGGPSIPADVKYEYAALNLSAIKFTISTGTVVRVRSGANQGGVVDSYYMFRPVVSSGVDIVLETENYGDTSRWSLLTSSRVAASGTTPARPSIAEIEASGQFYDSDVTQKLITSLTGKFYVVKPKALDAPTLTYQNLGSLLFDQRQQIVDWISSHATNTEAVARYTVQLQLLDQQLDTLGLTDVLVGVANANVVSDDGRLYRYLGATTAGTTDAIVLSTADYTNTSLWQDVTASNPAATYASNVKSCTLCQRVINRQLDGIFLSLPAIYAAPGSIFIQADDVDAGGLPAIVGTQLKARSQAKVTIANESPFSMKVSDVAILDSERVTVVDGELIVLAPGNVFFNGVAADVDDGERLHGRRPVRGRLPDDLDQPGLRLRHDDRRRARDGPRPVHPRQRRQRDRRRLDPELRRQHQRLRRDPRAGREHRLGARLHAEHRRLVPHEQGPAPVHRPQLPAQPRVRARQHEEHPLRVVVAREVGRQRRHDARRRPRRRHVADPRPGPDRDHRPLPEHQRPDPERRADDHAARVGRLQQGRPRHARPDRRAERRRRPEVHVHRRRAGRRRPVDAELRDRQRELDRHLQLLLGAVRRRPVRHDLRARCSPPCARPTTAATTPAAAADRSSTRTTTPCPASRSARTASR